jgi:hypothetical protein
MALRVSRNCKKCEMRSSIAQLSPADKCYLAYPLVMARTVFTVYTMGVREFRFERLSKSRTSDLCIAPQVAGDLPKDIMQFGLEPPPPGNPKRLPQFKPEPGGYRSPQVLTVSQIPIGRLSPRCSVLEMGARRSNDRRISSRCDGSPAPERPYR